MIWNLRKFGLYNADNIKLFYNANKTYCLLILHWIKCLDVWQPEIWKPHFWYKSNKEQRNWRQCAYSIKWADKPQASWMKSKNWIFKTLRTQVSVVLRDPGLSSRFTPLENKPALRPTSERHRWTASVWITQGFTLTWGVWAGRTAKLQLQ